MSVRLALIASALLGCRSTTKEPHRAPAGSAVTESAPRVIAAPTMREDMVAFPSGKARGRTLSCGTADPHDVDTIHPPDTNNDVPAFAIDRRPVSCVDYQACITAGVCPETGLLESCAGGVRAQVRHKNASTYCRWRSTRLPTYLEWQRAVRGIGGNVYPHGPSPDPSTDCLHPTEVPDPPDSRRVGCEQLSPDGVVYFTRSAVGYEWTSDTACGSNGNSGQAAVELYERLDEPNWIGDVGQFRCARTPK
ncbi:MAG: SUMF1/EgtB/PvdO family nonheme iron enzyme [Myxococcales bacterium]|nr:SUMF1/EgtB/PvdO family nonheme iron enzyme [Myxococcales bacterium]